MRIEAESDSSGVMISLAGPSQGYTTSSSDGRFHFSGLAQGDYVVVASAEHTREGRVLATAHVPGADPSELLFHAVGQLHGRATRAGSAAGNGGIRISLSGTAGTTATDDSGAFAFDEIETGTYDLTAATSGYATANLGALVLTRGAVTEVPAVDLAALPVNDALTGMVEGRVRLPGAADQSGVVVSIGGAPVAITAADGSFVIADPPIGNFSLSFAKGLYQESLPPIFSPVGSNGFIFDGQLYSVDQLTIGLSRGRLAVGGSATHLELTPNRDHLLYLDGQSHVMSVPLAGGAAVQLLDHGPLDSHHIFSPDGTKLVWVAPPPGGVLNEIAVYQAPVGGGPAIELGSFYWYPRQIAYSIDGTSLVAVAEALGSTDEKLWSLKAGSPPQVLAESAYYLVVGKGGFFILASCVGAACDLVRMGNHGESPTKLTSGVDDLLVADDGSAVAAWHSTNSGNFGSSLRLIDLTSNQESVIAGATTQVLGFSRSSGALVYTADGNLYAASRAAPGAPKLLGTGDFSRAVLAPSGKLLYSLPPAARELRATSIADGSVTVLASGVDSFELSPGGECVVGVDKSLGAQTGAVLALVRGGGAPAQRLAARAIADGVTSKFVSFSPDGSRLLYRSYDGTGAQRGHLVIAACDGSTALASVPNLVSIRAVSATSSTALVVDDDEVAWSVSLSDGTARGLFEHAAELVLVDDSLVLASRTAYVAPLTFQNSLYFLEAN